MTAKKPGTVVAEILAGRYDGHLADFQQAMRERVLSQATALRWKIVHPEVTVTEDDLTLGEAEMIERVTNQSWAMIDPYQSARECRAILTVVLQQRTDRSADEAAKITAELTVTDVTAMLQSYEVVAGPLEGSGPGSTGGSLTGQLSVVGAQRT